MVQRALIGATVASLAIGMAAHAQQAPARRATAPTLAQSKDVFLRVCGRCHPPERVTATRRTKAQWEESINAMVTSRGAVVAPDEYDVVLNYLVKAYSPLDPRAARGSAGARAPNAAAASAGRQAAGPAARSTTPPTPPRASGGAGPDDKHVVDAVAAARGRTTYAAACINCHGTQARGTERGPNLVRSLVVLHDRYGSDVGPFLRKGHQTQSGPPSTSFTEAQVTDLAHFLHERLNDTLRGSPIFTVQNVLTGDRQAGEAYFNGDGGCRQCHSPSGDLAGIGARFDPPALQQRFLFPRPPGRGPRARPGAASGKPVTVSVTNASGESVSGVLLHLDDFNVSLRDDAGAYRAWKRVPGLTVVKHDPYAAHIDLLDKYTDTNMHDIVAYLESLK